jgi:hypothetical protein
MAANTMPKMRPQAQGKIVAESHATWTMTKHGKVRIGEEWFVMFPDGSVQILTSKKAVTKAAKEWFKKTVKPGCVGIGKIEWRT